MEENKITEVFDENNSLDQDSLQETVLEESENTDTIAKTATENADETSEEAIEDNPNHRQIPKKKKKKMNKGLSILIRMLIIVVLSVVFAVFIILGFKDIYGLEFGNVVQKDVYIEKGATTAEIADVLYENGIIEQPLLFRAFCKLGENGGFQYGYHSFMTNMSYKEITDELKKLVDKKDVVEITVVEGWNFYDIAKELKAKGVISDIEKFSRAVDKMAVSYDYLKNVPDNTYRYFKYEGYFYPDKYEFYTGTNDYEGIAKKFFANFDRHMDREIKDAIAASKYSFDEIITIASIIQAEAGNVNEMGKVSSVFHNRLDSTLFPKLQSDVTINYVENAIKPSINYPNQELYDAYNTYKCDGLMPGAVCNPTKEAIRAALFPEETKYYYFVTDNTGKYYYATTLNQHNKNCATAKKVNDKLKK